MESVHQQEPFHFIDSPYYDKGRTLYLSGLDDAYHGALAKLLRSHGTSTPWVLTYDDRPEIRAMYQGWATIHLFSLRYVAAKRRRTLSVFLDEQYHPWASVHLRSAKPTVDRLRANSRPLP